MSENNERTSYLVIVLEPDVAVLVEGSNTWAERSVAAADIAGALGVVAVRPAGVPDVVELRPLLGEVPLELGGDELPGDAPDGMPGLVSVSRDRSTDPDAVRARVVERIPTTSTANLERLIEGDDQELVDLAADELDKRDHDREDPSSGLVQPDTPSLEDRAGPDEVPLEVLEERETGEEWAEVDEELLRAERLEKDLEEIRRGIAVPDPANLELGERILRRLEARARRQLGELLGELDGADEIRAVRAAHQVRLDNDRRPGANLRRAISDVAGELLEADRLDREADDADRRAVG